VILLAVGLWNCGGHDVRTWHNGSNRSTWTTNLRGKCLGGRTKLALSQHSAIGKGFWRATQIEQLQTGVQRWLRRTRRRMDWLLTCRRCWSLCRRRGFLEQLHGGNFALHGTRLGGFGQQQFLKVHQRGLALANAIRTRVQTLWRIVTPILSWLLHRWHILRDTCLR